MNFKIRKNKNKLKKVIFAGAITCASAVTTDTAMDIVSSISTSAQFLELHTPAQCHSKFSKFAIHRNFNWKLVEDQNWTADDKSASITICADWELRVTQTDVSLSNGEYTYLFSEGDQEDALMFKKVNHIGNQTEKCDLSEKIHKKVHEAFSHHFWMRENGCIYYVVDTSPPDSENITSDST